MRKWLQVIAAALILAIPTGLVLADLNVTEGSGKVLFGFTCFTTKECRTATLVNAAGTEVGTSAAPVEVNLRSATVGLAVTNAGTFATQATQAGTWTVQPGNTANSTAWLVTGTGGTFPATQSGTWTMQPGNTANTTPWLQIIRDAAGNARGANVNASNQLSVSCDNGCAGGTFNNNADGVATSSTNGQSASWLYGYNGTTWDRLRADTTSGLWVNVKAATGLAQGSTTSGQTGSLIMGAVTTGSPTYTTAQTSPLSLTTAGDVRVNCSNCSGSGVSAIDEAAFTAGTTVFAATGGFFQTTATNNALTNGQQGAWQMTANRAGFVNLRNAAGAEVGVTGAELFVGGRGTAGTATGGVLTVQGVASMTKLLVTPDSVALPANQSVNVAQINGVTPLMGNGTTGTGSQRVTIASDNTAFAVNAASTLAAETTKVIGTIRNLGNAGAIYDGAIGAAPPANVVYAGAVTSGATGGLLSGIVACDSHALLNMTTATTTEIVALTASQSIYVCSVLVSSNGTSAVKFVRGTGTNCGTGTADMSANHDLTAQVGFARGSGLGTIMRGTSANALCVTSSAAVNVHIDVTYAKF